MPCANCKHYNPAICLCVTFTQQDEPIEILPHIKIFCCCMTSMESFPPLPEGLEIVITDRPYSYLSTLPSTLVELHCSLDRSIETAVFPPLLRKLKLMHSYIYPVEKKGTRIMCCDLSAMQLPASLISFCLHCEACTLRLPHLEHTNLIGISLDSFGVDIIDFPSLPPTTKWFSNRRCRFRSPFVVPEHLQRLSLCCMPLPALTLSYKIIHLELSYSELTELPKLPPLLVMLNVRHNHLKVLPRLPSTLQVLHCQENQLTVYPQTGSSLQSISLYPNPFTIFHPLTEGLCTVDHMESYRTLEEIEILDESLLPTHVIECLPWLPDRYLQSYQTAHFDLENRIRAILSDRKRAQKERMVRRCLLIKEELMMNRWHPTRIAPMIEAGIDVEDI